MNLNPFEWLSRPSRRTGVFGVWGAPEEELGRKLDCDDHLDEPDQVLIRAIPVDAPAAHLYRWLTQMRVAPYSYDWIDNYGKQSPPELIPGMDNLEIGQRIAGVFKVIDFEQDRSITMFHKGPVFGTAAVTYLTEPVTETTSRLFGRLVIRYPRNPAGAAFSLVLPAGDLIMMRKQMQNFARLASESAP